MSGLRAVGSAVAPSTDMDSVDNWSLRTASMAAEVLNCGMLVLIRSTLVEFLDDRGCEL